MTVATHLVTADFSGLANGARIDAEVLIHDNLRGLAAATGLTPPVGYVGGGYIKASISNNVLIDASGSVGVELTSNDAALNIDGDLQYTFSFSSVVIDLVASFEGIPNITYAAPADGTAVDLIEQANQGLVTVYPLPQIPLSGVTGLSALGVQIATAVDAAAARTALGVDLKLTPTAVKTSAYTAAVGDLVPCNAATSFTVTLPPAPADGARIAVKKILPADPAYPTTPTTVTIAAGGSDVFNKTGGSTTLTLSSQYQAVVLQYKATGAIWYVVSTDVPMSSIGRTVATAADVETARLAVGAVPLAPVKRATQPVVCFTFDDAYTEDFTVVKPILDAQGIKAGFPLPSGYPGTGGRMSWANVLQLQTEGHEIIAHSVDHAHMIDSYGLTESQKQTEVNNRAAYESHGVFVQGFAYTFGEHDANLRRIVRQYYPYALGVLSGGASSSQEPLNTWAIKRVALDDTTVTATHTAAIDTAIANGEMLVFIIHSGSGSFTSGGGGIARLNDVIDYAQAHSVPILTPSQAFALVKNIVDIGDYAGGSNYFVISPSGKTYTSAVTYLEDSTSAIGTLPSAYGAGLTYQNVVATASPTTPRPDGGPGLLVTNIMKPGVGDAVTNMNRQDFYGTNGFGHWTRNAAANNASWGNWLSNLVVATGSTASSATPTPFNSNGFDYQLNVTALNNSATFGAPQASVPSDGQAVTLTVKDAGTAQALAFNAIYRFPSGFPAPTFTVPGQVLVMMFRYNSAATKWDYVAGTLPSSGPFGFPYTVDPAFVRSTDARTAPQSNGAIYLRVIGAGTISKIGLQVQVSSGNISVGVHQNSGAGRAAVPGARLATSGAVACPAVGYAEVSLGASVAVAQGDWISLSADNVTASFLCNLGVAADSNIGLGRQFRQPATAHPVPATPTGLIATVGYSVVLVGAP